MGRVLRRPSWIAFTVLVLVLAVAFLELGRWQWRRHDERAAFNDLVRASVAAPAVPADELLSVGQQAPESDEWRSVVAVGRYDAGQQLVVRNRVDDGQLGFEVLTPLVTAEGPALLVDRGWVPVGDDATDEPAVAPPPAGDVAVVAHVQLSEVGGAGDDGLPPGQVRRVDVADIARDLPYPVYGAYAAALPGEPGTGVGAEPPRAVLPPEPSGGPHLAYAIQWWIFIGIAMGGWVMLLRTEARTDFAATAGPARVPLSRRPHREDVDVIDVGGVEPDASFESSMTSLADTGYDPRVTSSAEARRDASSTSSAHTPGVRR